MKAIEVVSLKKRTGIYAFAIVPGNGVWVVYKKFSQPDAVFIIRVTGKDLGENFFNAIAEVDDLLPLDAAAMALRLSVPISPQVAENLLGSQLFIEKLAESFGIGI